MNGPFRTTSYGSLLRATLAAGLILAVAIAPLAAQAGAQTTQSGTVSANAEQVRTEFMSVLQLYPPSLGAILKLDPSLMTRPDYLTPYPGVAQFLKSHPEITSSPDYYFEQVRGGLSSAYYYDPSARAWQTLFEMVGVFLIVSAIAIALAWVIRAAVDYRRWSRQAKVQAEAHTKLLDRFTGNEELMAYVQSSAGSRFLQSAPITLDSGSRSMGAPLSRILWSMQAGIVLAAAGIGMNYVSGRIAEDMHDPFFMISVILVSLGIGFVVSAGLSFFLSKRFGLVGGDQRSTEA